MKTFWGVIVKFETYRPSFPPMRSTLQISSLLIKASNWFRFLTKEKNRKR